MAKSAKQKQIDTFKKGLWEAVQEQVQEAIENDEEITDSWFDWETVQQYLRDNAEEIVAAAGGGHKEYEGKLSVTLADRKKILAEVENSCLSEKAKQSFKSLLDG